MKLFGDELARSVDLRIHPSVPTQAAVDAILADDRPDGIVVTVTADQSQWQFVLASTAAASLSVRVPADKPASGRWLLVGANPGQPLGSGGVLVPVRVGVTIATSQFSALAAGVRTTAVPLGGVLPPGTRPLWRELTLTTPFTGGAASAVTLDIGGAVPNDIVAGQSLFAAAPSAMQGTSGINPNGGHGGQQLKATITSDVDLNQLTAGVVTIALYTGVLA